MWGAELCAAPTELCRCRRRPRPNLLADVPMYGGSIRGELCTPTGAALLVHFADSFGDMPVMSKTSVGMAVGTKEFEQANCVRVFLGGSTVNERNG